jgi:multidrug resistance efflux pump
VRRWRTCARVAAAAGLAALTACPSRRPDGTAAGGASWVAVEEGPFVLWSQYDGELAARRVVNIASQFNGGATITHLAPEGAAVRRGDTIVRFDGFQAENECARLEREFAVADAELRGLEKAVLPLERLELERTLAEAREEARSEGQYLAESRSLVGEGLVSEEEVARLGRKVEGLEAKASQLGMKLDLTREHIHPARLEEARAKREAAARQLELMRGQVAQCTVAAPCDGEVVYLPLPFGSEIRPVRVGDTVYKNQEFLCIPDPSSWVARCRVPERELARVRAGAAAALVPKAWPGLTLTGVVETVSAMAQNAPGAPNERVFPVTVRVDSAPPEIRSGLSVYLSILTRDEAAAVLVPRAAVRWAEGRPSCIVRAPPGEVRRDVTLGFGNERVFEVLDGLRPGEQVRL